jgi:hypothetical protein
MCRSMRSSKVPCSSSMCLSAWLSPRNHLVTSSWPKYHRQVARAAVCCRPGLRGTTGQSITGLRTETKEPVRGHQQRTSDHRVSSEATALIALGAPISVHHTHSYPAALGMSVRRKSLFDVIQRVNLLTLALGNLLHGRHQLILVSKLAKTLFNVHERYTPSALVHHEHSSASCSIAFQVTPHTICLGIPNALHFLQPNAGSEVNGDGMATCLSHWTDSQHATLRLTAPDCSAVLVVSRDHI